MSAFEKHIYKNGLRLITAPLKGTSAVTCLVLVGTGSRYETVQNNGVSHFLEHMFFKGGNRYKNTKEVSEAIDAVGGDFNAFTSKEYTGYYVKFAKEHLELGLDILSDMLLNATLPPEDVERERHVIIEEINMYEDTPMIKVEEEFEKLLLGKQPLGFDIAGPKETIQQMTRTDLYKYRDEQYVPGNILVILSGALDKTGNYEELVAKYFSFPESASAQKYKAYAALETPQFIAIDKPTEQAHLVLGVPACAALSNEKYATRLLSIILGGNMSSRLFLKVREQQGLCYYIRSESEHYLDTGLFTTKAGIDLQRVPDAVAAIREEYLLAARQGLSEQELKKARDFMKGKMTLALEDSEYLANLLGRQELLYNEALTPKELFAKYEEVSLKDLNELATKLFVPEKMKLAVIKPQSDNAPLEDLLKF